MNRKIRFGMIGGSSEGFIGKVHRMAAALDGGIELAGGAFSADPEKSRQTGRQLYLEENRVYGSFEEMILKEKSMPESLRMDFISIVTPNHLHFAPAKMALENGFHVLCEKPLAFSSKEASALETLVLQTGLVFGLTHNYTSYPMVKEARALVQSGSIGKIRKVLVEYPQGWLASNIESDGQKQATWRTDPAQAGISCCVADIGTHAQHLAAYITRLRITELAADTCTFVEGRLLEDDASILLRFENGAKGVIIASQIACGEENELKIKVYGERGGLEWLQSDPNCLILKRGNAAAQILKAGAGNLYLSEHARAHSRLPGGHPEGYIESLANLYRNFSMAIRAHSTGGKNDNALYDFPTISDGVQGMRFIEAVIESGKNNSAWIKI